MTIVSNYQELESALKKHIVNIEIPDESLGNAVLLAGRVQSETLNEAILKGISPTSPCRIALGHGITIQVKKDLAENTLQMVGLFDSYKTEIDVEDVKMKRINLYYNA